MCLCGCACVHLYCFNATLRYCEKSDAREKKEACTCWTKARNVRTIESLQTLIVTTSPWQSLDNFEGSMSNAEELPREKKKKITILVAIVLNCSRLHFNVSPHGAGGIDSPRLRPRSFLRGAIARRRRALEIFNSTEKSFMEARREATLSHLVYLFAR